mgnify:FL=1
MSVKILFSRILSSVPFLMKTYVPALLSIIAIVISWRSCHLASDVHKLNVTNFSASRTLTLSAKIIQGKGTIDFKPKDGMMELDSLYVYHPIEFSNKGVAFSGTTSSITLPLGSWSIPEEFSSFIMETVETQVFKLQNARENNTETLLAIGQMPLLVVSSHTSHAKRYHDASLYDLEFTYQVNLEEDETKTERQLEFTKVFFVSRLSDSDYRDFIQHSKKNSKFWIPIAERYRQYARP